MKGISILMKRGMVEEEYGVTRHFLEKAVAEGRVVPVRGRLEKKWAQYWRRDVEGLGDEGTGQAGAVQGKG